MNEALRDLGEYLEATIGGDVLAVEIAHDQLNLIVARSAVAKVLTLLRDDQNCQFKQLVELTAVDRPDQAERFEVVYNLLSDRKSTSELQSLMRISYAVFCLKKKH